MPLIYTLVKRKDMSKDAASGATLYHAQTSITKKLTLNKICTRIENICTASRGEIILVLDGLIKVMNEALSDGESIDQPRQQRLLRTLRPEKGRLQRIGRQWRWRG